MLNCGEGEKAKTSQILRVSQLIALLRSKEESRHLKLRQTVYLLFTSLEERVTISLVTDVETEAYS